MYAQFYTEEVLLPHLCLPHMGDTLRPLMEIVPIQLLAARLVLHQHIEPDVFLYGQKIVTQE